MKLPVIAHNRFWSPKTPYAKQNGGEFDFLIDTKSGMALPLQQVRLIIEISAYAIYLKCDSYAKMCIKRQLLDNHLKHLFLPLNRRKHVS